MGKKIKVADSFQRDYTYELSQPEGKNFDADFKPELTPKQMLELGVFGGNYFQGDTDELPDRWVKNATISDHGHDPRLNFFGIDASQPLAVWREKGWIYQDDPRGWFQWYVRYYMGRRIPKEDRRQIKRWKAIRRHVGQVQKNCRKGDMACRRKQRQVLLHWAYDSRRL